MADKTTASAHVISGNLDMLLGEEKYLPWSCSRMEVAGSCLHKFKQVYLEGIKEESPALTLGGLSHEIIADLLADGGEPSIAKAEIFLTRHYPMYKEADLDGTAFNTVRTFFPYMVEFVTKWKHMLSEKGIKRARVEHPYGLTRELTRAAYIPNDIRQTYLRGIIDLWAYDPNTQTLYIVDHKTNKSTMSKQKVKDHIQLNLYIAMISRIYKLKWKRAFVGLNFLRKNKIIWAVVEPKENAVFMDIFMNTLRYLEARLFECENSLVWPAERSFRCSWCALKEGCKAYSKEV